MRGTPGQPRRSADVVGIIPAHAGNTQSRCGDFTCSWDHPRACGEHRTDVYRLKAKLGSSPRMRGTLIINLPLKDVDGIIPAHAGNTCHPCSACFAARDHPRACGEHRRIDSWFSPLLGSSPRMRGTLEWARDNGYSVGIIPAHAGNTHYSPVNAVHPWDHPRACGEHKSDFGLIIGELGSSPRMRGTPFHVSVRQNGNGIIPAHAGNTRKNKRLRLYSRDHPRACGEHS